MRLAALLLALFASSSVAAVVAVAAVTDAADSSHGDNAGVAAASLLPPQSSVVAATTVAAAVRSQDVVVDLLDGAEELFLNQQHHRDDDDNDHPDDTLVPNPVPVPNPNSLRAKKEKKKKNVVRLRRRRAQNCPAGHCWIASRQQCYHSTSQECRYGVNGSGQGTDWSANGVSPGSPGSNGNNNNGVNNNGNTNWAANGVSPGSPGSNGNNNNNGINNANNNNGSGQGTDWAANGVSPGSPGSPGTTDPWQGWGMNGNSNSNNNGINNNSNNAKNNGNINNNNGSGQGTNWAANGVSPGSPGTTGTTDPWQGWGIANGINGMNTGQCGPGQCYVAALGQCYHVTSLECRFPPPTNRPTFRPPTFRPTQMVVTTYHPAKLTLWDLPEGYTLTSADRAHMMEYVKTLLVNQLDGDLQLVDVAFGGYLTNDDDGTFSLPMQVAVRGTSDASTFALSYIMDVLQNNLPNISSDLKMYKWDAFKNVNISSGTYDTGDVVDFTPGPTREPTPKPSRKPTRRPTRRPTPSPVEKRVTTTVPLVCSLGNLPKNYVLTSGDQDAVVGAIREVLEDNVMNGLDVIDVEFGGYVPGSPDNEVAVRVTCSGPPDVSAYATKYLQETLKDNMSDVSTKLKSIDWDTYKNVDLDVSTYDLDKVSYEQPMRVVNHPIKADLGNLPAGYLLTSQARDVVVNAVRELLEDNVDVYQLEVRDVSFGGYLASSSTKTNSVTLVVKTRGPKNVSESAGPMLQDILRDNEDFIKMKLKSLDWGTFKNVELSVDTYDLDEVTNEMPIRVVTHPLKVNLIGLPSDYTLTSEARDLVVDTSREILEDNLDVDGLEMRGVVFGGYIKYSSSGQGASVTLKAKTRGPRDVSEAAGPTLQDLIRDNEDIILMKLKSLDWDIFKDADLSVVTYDEDEVSDEMPIKVVTHPLKVDLVGLPSDYTLTSEARDVVVETAREILEDTLASSPLEIRGVAFGGYLTSSSSGQGASVTLEAKTRGPQDDSEAAGPVLQEIIRDNEDIILTKLKSLDWDIFKDVDLFVDTYDEDEVSDEMPIKVVTHPLKLSLVGLPSGYTLTSEARDLVVDTARDLLEENLDSSALDIRGVAFGGYLTSSSGQGGTSVTLEATTRGPRDDSEAAGPVLQEIIRENEDIILMKLKSLEWGTFKNVELSVGTYDEDEVTDEMPIKVETHPLKVNLAGLPSGYTLTSKARDVVVDNVREILEDNLDIDGLEMWGVAFGGYLTSGKSPSVTLEATTRGPQDVSEAAGPILQDIIRDNKDIIILKLKSLDYDTFKDVSLSAGTYDEDDVIDEARRPTPKPTRRPPASASKVKTTHKCQLKVGGISSSYVPSPANQASIVTFARDTLEEHLDDSLTLIGVEYMGERGDRVSPFPLEVSVRGPADESDVALVLIMSALTEGMGEMEKKFKSLDWKELKNAVVTVEVYSEPPIEVAITKTTHSVEIALSGMSSEYRLSTENRAKVIEFVEDLMEDNIDDSLELVEVKWAGGKKNCLCLPLLVTVYGLAKETDLALALVLEVLEDNKRDIEMFYKSLDWDELKDVAVEIKPSDPASETTDEPEPVVLKETEHSIELTLDDIAEGYSLSASDRAKMILMVQEMLNESLGDSLEIEVADARRARERSLMSSRVSNPRRLESLSLPLTITATGPADESGTALAQIMEAIEENKEALMEEFKSIDDAFENASLSAETFDPNEPTTPKPTRKPTPPPMPEMEKATHPVQVTLNNLPAGFRLSADDRSYALRVIKDLIEDNLDSQFQLVKVAYADSGAKPSGGGNRDGLSNSNADGKSSSLVSLHKNHDRSLLSSRNLASVPLPLLITLKGPADLSGIALSYLMDVLQDNADEIVRKLKSLDFNNFKDVGVSFGSYDPASVSGPSFQPAKMKETEHPVELVMEDVAPGYRLNAADRASIIRYVQELLEDNLDKSLQLIGVSDASGRGNNRGLLTSSPNHTRRLGSLYLPLLVKVKGPEESADVALSYVMDVLQDHESDLLKFMKSLDWNAFKDVSVAAEALDPKSIPMGPVEMEETVHPVQLVIKDVAPGYLLTAADQASITRFIKELLEDYIDAMFRVLGVAYAGNNDRSAASQNNASASKVDVDGFRAGGDNDPGKTSLASSHEKNGGRRLASARRLQTLALPLSISLEGPADQSDFALSYIMDVLQDKENDIAQHLKSLDAAFENVDVSPESYDDFASMAESSPGMVESRHPIEMAIDNVPDGYQLSATNRTSVVSYLRELLDIYLDESLDLTDVAYSGGGRTRNLLTYTRGRAEDLSLPLLVTAKGPEEESDQALGHILQALRDNSNDIELYLRTIDGKAFEKSKVSFKSKAPATSQGDDTPSWVTTWWIWLIVGIGLLFLLCCLCICCGFMSRYKERKEGDDIMDKQPIVVEKPVFVDRPLIVDRPVPYPPPPPPNAMVPYHQPNQNAMVPFNPRVNPPLVQRSDSLVPYTPAPAEVQQGRMLALPPSQDAFSALTSYMDTDIFSVESSHFSNSQDRFSVESSQFSNSQDRYLENSYMSNSQDSYTSTSHVSTIMRETVSTTSVLPGQSEPPGVTITEKKIEQKQLQIMAGPASVQHHRSSKVAARKSSKHLQIMAAPAPTQGRRKKTIAAREPSERLSIMSAPAPTQDPRRKTIAAREPSKRLPIMAAPSPAQHPRKKTIAAKGPSSARSVRSVRRQGIDPPEKAISQHSHELVPYEPPSQDNLQICANPHQDQEQHMTLDPDSEIGGDHYYSDWDDESYATQAPGHQYRSFYSEDSYGEFS